MNRGWRILLCLAWLWPGTAWAVEVQEITAANGLKAWLVEDRSLPLVTVRLSFKEAGTASDPQPLAGRAYLAGELLMEGAGKRDALAFRQALEERAIHLGTGVDKDTLNVSLECLSEAKEEAMALLGDMLARPRFDDSAVTRLKEETRARLKQMESSPEYALDRAWRATAYLNHPYGNPPLGTPESLNKLTRRDFQDYHRRYVTRGNVVIAATGDITPQELRRLLDEQLSPLAEKFTAASVADVTLGGLGKTVTQPRDIPQTLVQFGLPAVPRSDPDYFPLYVMNYILGGSSLNSRLGEEIREKKGLAYYAESQVESALHTNLLGGNVATRTDQLPETLRLLKQTIGQMRDGGVKQAEMEDAKNYLIGSFPLNLDTNGEVTGYLIAMQLYGLGRDYLERRNDLIRQVSWEDVNRVAKKYLDPDQLLIVLVGKTSLAETNAR